MPARPLGRPLQTTDGNGNVTTIAYTDGLLQSTVTTTPPTLPVGTTAAPTTKVLTDAGQGTITTTVTVPDGSPQKVSTVWLDYAGRTLKTPSATTDSDPGPATPARRWTNTTIRVNLYWTQDAVGTITKTDFDGLGRATNAWVGTSNTNLTEVESEQYDNNGAGTAI